MRILVLSMYYPPLNTIAALRTRGFVESMTKLGFQIDVITRYYDEEQLQGKSMFLANEKAKNIDKDYIKSGNIIYTNFENTSAEYLLFKKLPKGLRGLYGYYKIDIFHYGWVRYVLKAFSNECRNVKYDFVFTSYGPPIVLAIGKKIARLANAPWICEFRDIFIDERDRSYHLLAKRMIQQHLLKNATAFVFSTEGMRTYFNKYASKSLQERPSIVVYNGVDDVDDQQMSSTLDVDVLKAFENIARDYPFILLHTGTIYEGQNVKFFVDVVKKYNSINGNKVAIIFLGLVENGINELPREKCIFYLDKVNHYTAVHLQRRASALLLPIWENRYTGFSGKTFEYLSSGVTIFCGPRPQSDLLDFFNASGNVRILETFKDFEEAIVFASEKGSHRNSTPEIFKRSYWIREFAQFADRIIKSN